MGKFVDESIVIVKPLAYYKMLVHVLRFGSKTRDHRQFKEVIGMLVGHLEGDGKIKDVIIEDVVPISHGGSIEVKFTDEQLGAFGEIDLQIYEEHGSKNWFTVGWYHSHPGLNIFFSSTDVFNQLFWQDKNPSGVGLVFDHTYLENEGDLGFRAFRLDEPSKNLNSDYHEIKAMVEAPKEKSFYSNIIRLISNIQSNQPPLYELNETTDLFSEVFIPDKEDLAIRKPELHLQELISSLKSGISSFLDLSMIPLITSLNEWSQNITSKTYYNNTQIRNDLVELKNNLSISLKEIQKSFNFNLQDNLKKLDDYISDTFDIFEEEQDNIKQIFEEFKNKINQHLLTLFDEKLNFSVEQIGFIFENSKKLIADMEAINQECVKSLKKGTQITENLSKIIMPSEKRIASKLEENKTKIIDNYKKKIANLQNSITSFNKETKKIMSNLKAAILVLEGSKEPILNKLDKLENEKKNLHSSIKELKSEKQELMNQIKELKKGG
ncbi:MAG: hypothetical protein EU531_02200 [Promethearchaeota archaeon]|nr:MAG: hypothetical protein EU531_02200 [Candidatus Lokiarchaeota archaeon]